MSLQVAPTRSTSNEKDLWSVSFPKKPSVRASAKASSNAV
jgi:hypothetical protein